MALSARGRRIKGHDWEREVAKDFREIYDPPGTPFEESCVKRGLQSRGGEAPDVGTPIHWIECKNKVVVAWREGYRQACRDAERYAIGRGLIPLAICKVTHNRTPVVVLAWDYFMKLHERKLEGPAWYTEKSKQKARHAWAQEVVKQIRTVTGVLYDPDRGRARIWPDVLAPGLWISCRASKQAQWPSAFTEALTDVRRAKMAKELVPVAACKDTVEGGDVVAIMPYKVFFQRLKEFHGDEYHGSD